MCFGGGESASSIYKKRKPKFGPLPSLRMGVKEREPQVLKDVPRKTGMQTRSLLMPKGEY